MKLTEKQAFKLMECIEGYFGKNILFKKTKEGQEIKADFIMFELINFDLGED